MPERPRPAQVWLHAGFHKTGTTSLQSCLEENRAALSARFHLATLRTDPDLRQVTEAARRHSETGDALDLAVFRAMATGWLAGLPIARGQSILISSEDFAGHMPGMRGLRDYGAAIPLAQAFLAAVGDAFGKGTACAFVYTTRDADPWLASLHAQQARHAHLTLNRDEFAHAFRPAADLAGVVDRIAAAVAPAQVHRIALEEAAAHRLGPAGVLLALCGHAKADLDRLVPPARTNPALSPDLVAAFVALNRAGLPRDVLRARKAALLHEAATAPAPQFPVSAAGETR